VVKLNKNII